MQILNIGFLGHFLGVNLKSLKIMLELKMDTKLISELDKEKFIDYDIAFNY